MSGTSLPPHLRAYLSTPALAEVWAAARLRLERNGLQLAGTLAFDLDAVAAERLSGLLGRSSEGPGFCNAFVQLNGSSRPMQCADHSETMNRCAGRLHEAFGSYMWSWRTKLRA